MYQNLSLYKHVFKLNLWFLILAFSCLLAFAAPFQGFSGRFMVAPPQFQSPEFQEIAAAMKDAQFLEVLADELNKTVHLPENVTLGFGECGTVNAFFDPETRSVIICYELMDYFEQMFAGEFERDEDIGDAVIGATTFTLFHELGHALVHVLQLPITGKEEDAVDQLSATILLSEPEFGVDAILDAATWFFRETEKEVESGMGVEHMPFYDEHAMNGSRFFNLICWTYGSNPEMFAELVGNPLPAERAQRCPGEFERFSAAWDTLLKDYIK